MKVFGSVGFDFRRFGETATMRRNSAKNALVADSGNPSRCTRARQTRINQDVWPMHVSPAQAPTSQRLELGAHSSCSL